MTHPLIIYIAAATGFALGLPAGAATLPGIGEFVGTAGIGAPDGDVATPPVGTNFVFVTTSGSTATTGYGLGSETNGSELTTNPFTAAAGSLLQYFFNYVTSDGAGFADYAYATLNDLSAGTSVNLFNARTTVTGDTVPGFGLPAIDAGTTLTPASSAIIDGAPIWNKLGDSSDTCFDIGCGYTGWIGADYTVGATGQYSFTIGVTNWADEGFDSGFAIAGLNVDGVVIVDPDEPMIPPVPLPAAGFLLLGGLGALTTLRRRRMA